MAHRLVGHVDCLWNIFLKKPVLRISRHRLFLFFLWRYMQLLQITCAMDPRLRGDCAKIFVSRF